MRLEIPPYHKRFRCLAGSCPDSCCKEWDVEVDEASAASYRSLSGTLGDKLRAVLKDTENGTVMLQENRRCPMWRQDGLCEIQAQLGETALCQVCRDFPRISHDYGEFMELGLELSCPEAARLILTAPPEPFISQEIPGGSAAEYDRAAMEVLLSSREALRGLLSDECRALPERLAILLVYSSQVEAALWDRSPAPLEPDPCLKTARELAAAGNLSTLLDFYAGLEILTPAWQKRLAAPQGGTWAPEIAALARYGIERYWLQAVSDGAVWARAKLIIASCLVVNALGGDGIATAQLYSKEVENDPENIDAILDGAYAAPALTDANLLGLLLGSSKAANFFQNAP